MATLVQPAEMETLGGQSNTGTSPTSAGSSPHFNDGKFYLLVVIGEIVGEDHLKCAIADIEKGEIGLWGVGGGCRPPRAELHTFRASWTKMFILVVHGEALEPM